MAADGLAESAALIATDPDAFDATAVSSQLTDFVSSTFAAAGRLAGSRPTTLTFAKTLTTVFALALALALALTLELGHDHEQISS